MFSPEARELIACALRSLHPENSAINVRDGLDYLLKAELLAHMRKNDVDPPKFYFEPGVRLERSERNPAPILSKADLLAFIARLREANGHDPRAQHQMDTTQ